MGGFLNQTIMHEKDRQLIEQARKLHYSDWDKAIELAELAESEDAKKEIKSIGSRLYHIEESITDRSNGLYD